MHMPSTPTINRREHRARRLARARGDGRARRRFPALAAIGAGMLVLPASASACTQTASFGLLEATTAGCLTASTTTPGALESTDPTIPVTVNGADLRPGSGGTLRIVPPDATHPGGQLRISPARSIEVAGVKWGSVNWNLPSGSAGGLGIVATTFTLAPQKLYGLDIVGPAFIRMGWDGAGRYFRFDTHVRLPAAFRNGPTAASGSVTATVSVRADAAGVHVTRLQVPSAYVGKVQVQNVCLSHVAGAASTIPCSPPPFGATALAAPACPGSTPGGDRWDGSAVVRLPTLSRPQIGVYAGLQGGSLSYAGTQLVAPVPLAPGALLQSAALKLCATPAPLTIGGSATVRLLPSTPAAVEIAGAVTYTDSTPWEIKANGTMSIGGRPVASGHLRWLFGDTVEFGASINWQFGPVGVQAALDGWFQHGSPAAYNVDATGQVCVGGSGCATGEVTVSSRGIAACANIGSFTLWRLVPNPHWSWRDPSPFKWLPFTVHIRGGVGHVWGGATDVMGGSCDVGPYRAARLRSSSAAASSEQTLIVEPNERVLALRLRGAADPPRVAISGPNKRSYAPGARGGQDVLTADGPEGTMLVTVVNPEAGRWTFRSLDGAPFGVERAPAVAPASVLASVSEGPRERTLGYAYAAAEGRRVSFEVLGEGGYRQDLGKAVGSPCGRTSKAGQRARCGSLRFTAVAADKVRQRKVYAIVRNQAGLTVTKTLVDTFDAPLPSRPAKVEGVEVTRRAGSVTVGWDGTTVTRADQRPDTYDVTMMAAGRSELAVRSASERTATFSDIGRETAVRVSVQAVSRDGTRGPASRLTVRRSRASTVKTDSRARGDGGRSERARPRGA